MSNPLTNTGAISLAATGNPTKHMPPNAGKGRPKGARNKQANTVARAVKEAFIEAGGKAWLLKLAEEDPRAFSALLSRLMCVDAGLCAQIRAGISKTVSEQASEPPKRDGAAVVKEQGRAERGISEQSHVVGVSAHAGAIREPAKVLMGSIQAPEQPGVSAQIPARLQKTPAPLASVEEDTLPGQAPQRKVHPLRLPEMNLGTTGTSVPDWDPLEEIRKSR